MVNLKGEILGVKALKIPYDPHASQASGLSSEQAMSAWFWAYMGSRVSAACFSTVNLMASAAALVRR
jgi:hypothetical protein